MLPRGLVSSLNRVFSRTFHPTPAAKGPDSREKRSGHLAKTDKLDGEYGTMAASHSAFEYIDENLMDKVVGDTKFNDIPILTITCTRNNTKIALAASGGLPGQTMIMKSAGTEGFKNCRKGTTVAAQAVANRIVTWAQDNEINTARLVFNGLGPGRGAAYKVFELSGIKIVSLSDRTEAIEPWIQRPRKRRRI